METAKREELEQLASLLAALEQPTAERRRFARSQPRSKVPATLERGTAGAVGAVGRKLDCTIRDVSRSGIGLLAPEAVPVGEIVTVSFQLGARPVRATCRVANCRPDVESAKHIVGMAFTRIEEPGATTTGGGFPPGETTSAREAMAGAEPKHVTEVSERLKRMLSE